jgi:hypothetical protein
MQAKAKFVWIYYHVSVSGQIVTTGAYYDDGGSITTKWGLLRNQACLHKETAKVVSDNEQRKVICYNNPGSAPFDWLLTVLERIEINPTALLGQIDARLP